MNLLCKTTLLFAIALAMGNLYAQSVKTADAGNDSQALIKKCQSLGYVKGTPQMKQCIAQVYVASPEISSNQPQQNNGGGKVIGSSFDSQANGNIFLYDGACQLPNYASSYPLHWDAKKVDDGAFIGDGCYSYNQQTQQVFIVASTGKTASLPMSAFQNGGGDSNKSAFQSFSEGLQRATTYWNNSANDTQRNTTNLTPSFSGGNRGMNCTPDGRGGYNCR